MDATENRSANQAVDHAEGHGMDRPDGIIGFATNTNVQSSTARDESVHLGAEPERDAPRGWKYQFATLD